MPQAPQPQQRPVAMPQQPRPATQQRPLQAQPVMPQQRRPVQPQRPGRPVMQGEVVEEEVMFDERAD
jgi:hypothetical protein